MAQLIIEFSVIYYNDTIIRTHLRYIKRERDALNS